MSFKYSTNASNLPVICVFLKDCKYNICPDLTVETVFSLSSVSKENILAQTDRNKDEHSVKSDRVEPDFVQLYCTIGQGHLCPCRHTQIAKGKKGYYAVVQL